jgi:hypothetical protein
MRTQANVAGYLRERGWPFAESTGAGRPGVDVTGCPDLAVEVKARADLAPVAWMRQAESSVAGSARYRFPLVVYRANGMGEDAGRYLAIVRFADLVDLLTAAGYGDGQQDLGISVSRNLGAAAPLHQPPTD